MGFWNGRITYTRYRVGGPSPLPFSDELLELARKHRIGQHGSAEPKDGTSSGWSGGDHVLDVDLDIGKNIVGDALHLANRVDTDKVPAALLRAYTQIEIEARARQNPSGIATKAQKQEAKEAANIRALAEGADGRFRRFSHYPVLWDGLTNTLYAGTTSTTVLERLQSLFRETFERELVPITAGSLAREFLAANSGNLESPLEFLGDVPLTLVASDASQTTSVAWSGDDPASLDHLGNELLVWIWHTLQNQGDTIALPDSSDVSVMLAKTLTLDCPRGQTGRDTLTDDSPTRLPEALRALQAGKLPRKAGMLLGRHGAQYELTLQAENLSVSGLSLPKPDGVRLSAHESRLSRLESLRDITQTLDLLLQGFLVRRIAANWNDEVSRIRHWLQAA
jgi:hypothetical protein